MSNQDINNNESNWMSLSDIMTGLMVIFMFIAISYMVQIQKKQKERDIIFEEFKATKEKLYAELEHEFKDDFKKWDVMLDKDLSIKFANPDVLFASGSYNLETKFKRILIKFLPRYFSIVLKDEYQSRISEIRIEGHTDDLPDRSFDKDPYIANIILSQERSTAVLRYFRKLRYYRKLSKKKKKQLEFWLTANGLSYGRTLDLDNNLTAVSKKKINRKKSRRVEFRIVTTSSQIVDKVIKQLEK